jgi:hypothetical protein
MTSERGGPHQRRQARGIGDGVEQCLGAEIRADRVDPQVERLGELVVVGRPFGALATFTGARVAIGVAGVLLLTTPLLLRRTQALLTRQDRVST